LRGTLALALVALAGAAVAVWFAWSGRPVTLSAGTAPVVPVHGSAEASSPVAPTGRPRPTPEDSKEIVVDVAGLVARPGVVTLPPDSRVTDAIEAAGGVLPGTDTTGLSLARKLVDGEQVLVDGHPGPAAPQAASGGSGASSSGAAGGAAGHDAGPLDLNTATAQDFDELPGVGPVLAERIVEWRDTHGRFTSPEQLGEVSGVGDKRLAELLPLVTVG
jgi:competence protein ComEA